MHALSKLPSGLDIASFHASMVLNAAAACRTMPKSCKCWLNQKCSPNEPARVTASERRKPDPPPAAKAGGTTVDAEGDERPNLQEQV